MRLLKAIRAAGLPEPQKQHEVYDRRGRLLTRADFAYVTPKRILIYADGLEFHSGLRQRIHDTRQSNQLQTEGWQVLRFLGPHVHSNPTDCVAQLQKALLFGNRDGFQQKWQKKPKQDYSVDWILRDRRVIDGLDHLGIELVSVNLYQAMLTCSRRRS